MYDRADDLYSVVRALYCMFRRPVLPYDSEDPLVEKARKLRAWSQELSCNFWRQAEAHARDASYDGVARALTALMRLLFAQSEDPEMRRSRCAIL
eukprot:m.60094 g.60094  ORF g.60094 m.60094 type:complete len:95 (+) comp7003_c0_seq1:1465-1749(+)